MTGIVIAAPEPDSGESVVAFGVVRVGVFRPVARAGVGDRAELDPVLSLMLAHRTVDEDGEDASGVDHRRIHDDFPTVTRLPILTTELRTFDAANAASHTRGTLGPTATRKVDTAIALTESRIDALTLLDGIDVQLPEVLTPQMFEQRLPVLQGLGKPINDLSRGASVTGIVHTVAVTAGQAQEWPGDG